MYQRFIAIVAALFCLMVAGCDGSSSNTPAGQGDLNVSLTDAASPDYKAVYVSVNQVEVKASSDNGENGWQVIDIVNKTINLLDLTGGILEDLGTRTLQAQTYNQLRLILADAPDEENNLNGNPHPHANYVILDDGSDTVHELKIPSGYQSGIKLVKQFTIETSGLTELILDFDAMKSVVQAGNSGQWLLKPVIEVLDTVTLAEVRGSVTNNANPGVAQQDAHISAQVYNAIASDEKDRISIQAGTLTIADGSYILRVPEGEYRIIAYKEGFRPQCTLVSATSGETVTENFALATSASNDLTVRVTGLTSNDDSVTLSIRRNSLCTNGSSLERPYEVTSRSYSQAYFAAGNDAVFTLPSTDAPAGYNGQYTVVIYGDNIQTRSQTETLTIPQLITFSY